jgi:hypothetical protein
MGVTRQGREWRWLLHEVSESSRRFVTLTVTDGVASGAGQNHGELVSDRLTPPAWSPVQTNEHLIQHHNVALAVSILCEDSKTCCLWIF